LGIDGHSELLGLDLPSKGFLPFLIEPEGDRFIAFLPDRSAFLADDFPYVESLDGKDLPVWCEAAAVLVPKGSPQFVRRQCRRQLRSIDDFRVQLKLPVKETIEAGLVSRDGKTRRTITLPVASRPPGYGIWPKVSSKLLRNGVGYLRLAEMNDAA